MWSARHSKRSPLALPPEATEPRVSRLVERAIRTPRSPFSQSTRLLGRRALWKADPDITIRKEAKAGYAKLGWTVGSTRQQVAPCKGGWMATAYLEEVNP